MADKQVREGLRAMRSGGLSGLSPEDRVELNQLTANSLRQEGQPLSLDEIEYLQQYIRINERFLDQGINSGDARREINALNEKFSHLHESVLRTALLGSHLAGGGEWNDDIEDYEDGWVPSQACW